MRIRTMSLGALTIATFLVLAACGGANEASPAPSTGSTTAGDTSGTTIEVTLRERPFRFIPPDSTFEVGKTYTLVLKSVSAFHTFTVGDLGIDIPVNGGETVTQTFTPTKSGTFRLICIPHESLGMVGEIVVR